MNCRTLFWQHFVIKSSVDLVCSCFEPVASCEATLSSVTLILLDCVNMSEEGNKDFSESRGTADQESPQVSSSPEVRREEVGDNPGVSREDAGASELDSSKRNSPSSTASSPPIEGPEEPELKEQESLSTASSPLIENPEEPELKEQEFLSTASSPLIEGSEESELNEEFFKGVSPTSPTCSPHLEGAVGGTESPLGETDLVESPLGETDLVEFNKIAAALNRCSMTSGKLRLFQMYFREPGMMFFVKPEGRTRHNAARQTSHQPPTDSTQQEGALGGGSRVVPMPVLNQARAVIGYSGQPPQRDPLDNESDTSEHSIGSAETIPIEEVYLPSFSSIFMPEDPLQAICPSDARLQQRGLGVSQAVDIPTRPASGPGHSGSYPSTRPVLLGRRYSLEFEPYVPSRTADQLMPKRKISQDSSTDSEKLRPLSRESSVDLETYMTSKPRNEADNETSLENREFPSADSPNSPPVPDLVISSIQEHGLSLDSSQASAMDSTQMSVPQDPVPEATDEGESSESTKT